ncbi:MAG: hypothetical protein ACM3MD_03735, partial [Betaproteobacteria bacterium]
MIGWGADESVTENKTKRKNNGIDAGRAGLPPLVAVVMAAAMTAAIGFWWHMDRQVGTSPTSALSVAVNVVDQPAPSATPRPAFENLTGLWQRPDGGYLIEIRSVRPDGEMDAAYFNPRPINVAKAEAYQDGAAINVFIELRDLNYPGSRYHLQYDPV